MEGWVSGATSTPYNANVGVGVIFGAATKAILFTGVRNKINIVQYVPLVVEIISQLHHTSVTVIGPVALAAWKLIQFWKDFGSQRICMG